MHDGDDKLAKDIARLYSWANVENAPYRDFVRQRKSGGAAVAHTGSPESARDLAGDPRGSSESQTEVPDHPIAAPLTGGFEKTVAQSKSAPANEPISFPVAGHARPRVVHPPLESSSRGEVQPRRPRPESGDFRPVIAIYSLAGGVGKTTLAANLGRALNLTGDKVLLVDSTGSGLLPFYFRANDLTSESHGLFSSASERAALRVIEAGELTESWLNGELRSEMDSSFWTIFDLGPAATSLLPQIFEMCSFLIVPLLPDLNSILTISRMESTLEVMRSRGAEIPSPFYMFNQFDPADPVDQSARDLVLRECGGRLLPLSIRHDSEAARAIASRMTVIDHAPGAEIAKASVRLAALLRRTVTSSSQYRSRRQWNEA